MTWQPHTTLIIYLGKVVTVEFLEGLESGLLSNDLIAALFITECFLRVDCLLPSYIFDRLLYLSEFEPKPKAGLSQAMPQDLYAKSFGREIIHCLEVIRLAFLKRVYKSIKISFLFDVCLEQVHRVEVITCFGQGTQQLEVCEFLRCCKSISVNSWPPRVGRVCRVHRRPSL